MGYETYVGISREQLLVKMQQLLPEKRFKHCLGVEQAAIDLAERFGVDVEKLVWQVCSMIMRKSSLTKNFWR